MTLNGARLTFTGSTANLPYGDAPKSTSAWVRCSNSLTGQASAFEFGDGGVIMHARFSTFFYGAGDLTFRGHFNDLHTGRNICNGAWRHVAIVYAGFRSSVTIYVDSRSIASGTIPEAQVIPTSPGVYVGWNGNPNLVSGQPFPGSISNARIFNFALTAAQVAADFNLCAASVTTTATGSSIASATATRTLTSTRSATGSSS